MEEIHPFNGVTADLFDLVAAAVMEQSTYGENGSMEIFWIVPALNRRRFYCISVEPGLFGPVLTRSWGRIGVGRMRSKELFFPEGNLNEALEKANRLLAIKLRKG
jgi:predicted DNA-binding WGR domain protein